MISNMILAGMHRVSHTANSVRDCALLVQNSYPDVSLVPNSINTHTSTVGWHTREENSEK